MSVTTPYRRADGPKTVTVVGAGIIGISIALHLAQRGVHVTVLDQRDSISPCTDGAFAMLIATHPDGPPEFNTLYGHAIDAWHRFDDEFDGALDVRWEGALMWAEEGDAARHLGEQYERLSQWGSAVERIDARNFASYCDGVETGPVTAGYCSTRHGVVDPAHVWKIMRARCIALGVAFVTRTVSEINVLAKGCGLPHAYVEGLPAPEVLVLAAGEGTAALAASQGAEVAYTIASGSLAHSKPIPRRALPALVGPRISVKQNADGRIVAGLDYAPNAACDDTSEAYGTALLAEARRLLPGLPELELQRVTHGRVPIPRDTQPIAGFLDNIANCYVAVMMSGITMAPLMGQLIADEIVFGRRHALLAPYAPSRFKSE